MVSITQTTNIFMQLTPCRVVSTSNLVGTYFNGSTNNGVGAQLTASSNAALVIDSVSVNVNDRILLVNQSSGFQNGVYVVLSNGSVSSPWIIQRAADQQSIEQYKGGQYIPIYAGTVNAGAIYLLIEPLPGAIGFSNIVFDAATSSGEGTFLQIANNLSDVASVSTARTNLGLGTAATKTASNNSLTNVASVSGATVIGNVATFADIAGTVQNGGFAVRAQTASNAGGAASQTITDAFITTGTVVIANWATSANAVTVQKVTPGTGNFTVLSSADAGAGTLSYIAINPAV